MSNRQINIMLILILLIVSFNIIISVYLLLINKSNLDQSENLYKHKVKFETNNNQQIESYLESPILPLTPNPLINEWNGTGKPNIPWYFKDGTLRPTRARIFHENGIRSSKVWPEEEKYNDRIEEQLMFIPPDYKFNDAPMKMILLYNDFEHWMVDVGNNEFISKNCPVNKCTITKNITEAPIADAIVFHNKFSYPRGRKIDKQVWIMSISKSACQSIFTINQNMINWTATYRHDSDIVRPYGRWAYYNPTVTVNRIYRNYAENKTKQVAMFNPKCETDNARTLYAKNLGKHISVHIYGNCGESETIESDDFKQILDQNYKFYLAFEHSNCTDYVTQKFFVNGLQHNAIPIVMGARREDYERMAPRRSYIHVDDFKSPEKLARYLRRLDANDALYNEYFNWKGTGEFIDTRFFCRLCAMLHDTKAPSKNYPDIGTWWNGPGVCDAAKTSKPVPWTSEDDEHDKSEDDDRDKSEDDELDESEEFGEIFAFESYDD